MGLFGIQFVNELMSRQNRLLQAAVLLKDISIKKEMELYCIYYLNEKKAEHATMKIL